MSINTEFCREMLAVVMVDIKQVTSPAERKAAWVYKLSFGDWEFHGPDGYYWSGGADNAYDARASGWTAWWEHIETTGARQRRIAQGKRERQEQALKGRK